MTTTISNSLISRFTSFFQYYNPRRSFVSAPPTFEELNSKQALLTEETFKAAVAYLADHSDAELEKALKEKINVTEPATTVAFIKSICTSSLQENRLKMIEICKRIVSLDQLKSGLGIYNPMEIAQRESLIIPKRKIEKIADTAVQNWDKYSKIFGKIICWNQTVIQWFQTWMIAFLVAQLTTLSFLLNNPFSNFKTLQGYWKACLSMIDGSNKLNELINPYLEFLPAKRTAALVGIAILISAIATNYFHKRFCSEPPKIIDKIDKKGLFQNKSLEAQNGQIKQMKGRLEESRDVKKAWNVPQGEKFRFALLVGPAGSGKTEFVNGLAWESVNKTDSFVSGKMIFTLNTIELVREGTYYLNETLANIKDKDNTILFFDECHTAGAPRGQIGPLIEALKTALHAHNIRAIFATDKYEEYIAHNTAFVSRCNIIVFKKLPNSDSKKLLQSKVELDDRLIEVNANAYDALLSVVSQNLEGCNPREMLNLYNNIRAHVYSWAPKQLSQQLDTLILEKEDIVTQGQTENDDPTWSNSENGKTLESKLKEKEKEILELNNKLITQKSCMDKIDRLRKLGPQYRKKYNEVVHQAATTANEELQKEFLYLKYVLRPALQSALAAEAKELEEKYQEKLPLKIDADLIKKLYPDAFSNPKDISKSQNLQNAKISSTETSASQEDVSSLS